MFRTLVLPVLAAGLLWLTVITWGSLVSAVTAFLLITMGASLLYQKFLTHRNDDTFQDE